MARDLIIRPNLLPDVRTLQQSVGREIARELKHMDKIAAAAEAAVDAQSEIVEYAQFKAVNSVKLAGLLKRLSCEHQLSPEVNAEYEYLTRDYLHSISQTTHLANDRIFALLASLPTSAGEDSLWERFRDFISE